MPFPRTSFTPAHLTQKQENLAELRNRLEEALAEVKQRIAEPDQPCNLFVTMQSVAEYWMARKADGNY